MKDAISKTIKIAEIANLKLPKIKNQKQNQGQGQGQNHEPKPRIK